MTCLVTELISMATEERILVSYILLIAHLPVLPYRRYYCIYQIADIYCPHLDFRPYSNIHDFRDIRHHIGTCLDFYFVLLPVFVPYYYHIRSCFAKLSQGCILGYIFHQCGVYITYIIHVLKPWRDKVPWRDKGNLTFFLCMQSVSNMFCSSCSCLVLCHDIMMKGL